MNKTVLLIHGQAEDDIDDLTTLSELEVQNILNGDSEDERSKAGKGYINKPDDEDRHPSHSSRPTTMGDIFCEPLAKSLERRLHVCEADVERGAVALMKSATRLERLLRKLRECEKSKHCDVNHVNRIIRRAAYTVKHCLFL
ncbi:hypothetical protein B566_EDAN010008 [Ephemera danica]|nr:hypothetical protein B566_EDAN010008 [Ephemera danica]